MENSVVVHWPESRDSLVKWVVDKFGEVGVCECCGDGVILVELVLENECEKLMHHLQNEFPECKARMATESEYNGVKRSHSSTLRLKLGGWVECHIDLDVCKDGGGGTGSKLWPGGLLLAEFLIQATLELSFDDLCLLF